MDLAVILGLIVGVGAVLGGNLMEGGTFASLIVPSAFVIVVGGTIGATMISYSLKDLLRFPVYLKRVFLQPSIDLRLLIERIVESAQIGRREGLLALEESIPTLEDPFLARGIQMVVDGADPDTVRNIMEMEIDLCERENEAGVKIFETAGGYSPTMGIVGTVLGLIHVLGNLESSEGIGASIAVAFLATFYGLATANLFWLPLASKLRTRNEEEVLARELILEGVISIHRGDNPSTVRSKLMIFLNGERGDESEVTAQGMRASEQNV